ncbi:MAG: arylsulfatase [Lentisphaerae bacterium GWF2_44_16]|nr:MAG: arylsulfatase [Lentisphaerae bacterium GWF2_44_16]
MKPPNIVYILADDMGYGDLSCLNENSKIHTENLDRTASEGIIFLDAHSSSSVCTPSRYSILTGRYSWRSKLKQGVTLGYTRHLLEDKRLTVASFLKKHGYNTGCVGKWHLGMDWALKEENPEDLNWQQGDINPDNVDFAKPVKKGPIDYGFDYYFGISASLDMAPYVYIENDRCVQLPDHEVEIRGLKYDWYRKGFSSPDFKHEEVLPKTTEKAVNFIREKADDEKPFFLYFPLSAPHAPILPTEEFKGKSNTNEYGDFCLQVDWTVGQIMKALDEKGIADNTILIFTSDNGCSPVVDFKELASFGHNPNYVFRGHKADIYEGGHRIPLLVRWPEKIKPGSTSDETVCLSDLLATCADILGDKLPDNAGEDSVSNLPIWLGKKYEKPLREATVHHSFCGNFSIRRKNWKLEMCPGSGGWSYPKPGEGPDNAPKVQLYDISQDIGERKNVCGKYPEIVKELTALLTKYVKKGRSTPGTPQANTGIEDWPQLNWFSE